MEAQLKGHSPDECEAKRRDCNHCGERGHISNACPNKGKDQDKTDKTDKASDLALAAILKKMDDKLDKLDQRMTKMETSLKGVCGEWHDRPSNHKSKWSPRQRPR